MPIHRLLLAAVIALATVSCVAGGPRGAGGDRNVITEEQIREQAGTATAYDIVQRIRPHMLQRRGSTSLANPEPAFPLVYVDGMRRGEIHELRQVPASAVLRIEYISAADATTRWGTGHTAGVIAVQTRR
jgi:hypothetical protein